MIEYPTIIGSAKAPRKAMIAFEKLDGSNIRVKWTAKKGFHLFGSRNALVDASHPYLGGVVDVFDRTCKEELDQLIRKNFGKEKEVIVFGEYFGPNSFAGIHDDFLSDMRFVTFDLMLIKKSYTEFLTPQDFVNLLEPTKIPIPRIIYEGNLTDGFVQRVRNNEFEAPLDEGVVCKGRERSGAYRGKVWMCKIKTLQYMERLKQRYGAEWMKYWE